MLPLCIEPAGEAVPLLSLLAIIGDAAPWEGPPLLVRVSGVTGDGSFDVGFKEMERRHPVDVLSGFRAPKGWKVLGIVSMGWVAPMDEGSVQCRPSKHPHRRRVRTVQLASRSGALVSALRYEGGTTEYLAGGEGRVGDVLRRNLGLASTSAPPDPTEWLASIWLEDLISLAENGHVPRWSQMAALHPALRRGEVGAPTAVTPAALIAAGRRMAGVATWEVLRRETASGRGIGGIDPTLAGWMDDAMFGNEVVGRCRPIALLVDTLEALVGGRPVTPIRKVLCGWGLPAP